MGGAFPQCNGAHAYHTRESRAMFLEEMSLIARRIAALVDGRRIPQTGHAPIRGTHGVSAST